MSKKKDLILISIGLALLIILTVSLSYALYSFTGSGTKENIITTGSINVTFSEKNNIKLENRYPETDSEGLNNTDTNSQMTFTVSSNISGDTKVNYALGITDIKEGTSLTEEYVKIYLKKGNSVVAGFTENKGEVLSNFKNKYVENAIDSHVLLTDVISGSEVHTYTLKAWIDENYKLTVPKESDVYEVVNVSACASVVASGGLYDGFDNPVKEATGVCDGTGDSRGMTFAEEISENASSYTQLIQYMLANNIIKQKTELSHNGVTKEETFTFKIKGYGTTESLSIKSNSKSLSTLILGTNNSNVLSATATLSDTYSSVGDASGLYKSTDEETDGGATYFYRGAVTNNYVKFAGKMWKIIRINENGTIRLLSRKNIVNYSSFNNTNDNKSMYYSNSDVEGGAKYIVDTWYNDNLKNYENYIADTEFCEMTGANLLDSSFKCTPDRNGKGSLILKVGLLTYDEALHAGNHPNKDSNSYITDGTLYCLMSPATLIGDATIFLVSKGGKIINSHRVTGRICSIKPVISLKADTLAIGSGTEADPYVVQTR